MDWKKNFLTAALVGGAAAGAAYVYNQVKSKQAPHGSKDSFVVESYLRTDTDTSAPDCLSEDEARYRSQNLSNVRYELILSLRPGSEYDGDCTIHFTHRHPSKGIFLDFTGKTIRLLRVNGREVKPGRQGRSRTKSMEQFSHEEVEVATDWHGHRIYLSGDLLRPINQVRVAYTNDYDHNGEGFHQFKDPEDGEEYYYTNFEPFDAHKLFPCFDQPDLKAPLWLIVHAPEDWVVIANGPVADRYAAGTGDESLKTFGLPRFGRDPETGRAYGNQIWEFETTPPISSYIYALAAGPYHHVHTSHNNIPLGLYCRKSFARYLDAEELLLTTKQGLDFFQDFFAYPYPFAKYDQLFVPEFNSGAMENPGCVTFHESYLFRETPTDNDRVNRADTILHEMAHMWFGNLVTMVWWDGLWLNESFATYAAALAIDKATRFETSWQQFHLGMKCWAYKADWYSSTHPIAGTVTDTDATFTNFDGITYGKGASVLKQLVSVIGLDAFRDGMRLYFRRYEWSNTTIHEFVQCLEEGAQRPLQDWVHSWLSTAGLNTIKPIWSGSNHTIESFSIQQTAPLESPTLRAHHVEIGLFYAGTKNSQPFTIKVVPVDVVGALTAVPSLVGQPMPLAVFVNYNDHAYVKSELDSDSITFFKYNLEKLADPLTRQLIYRAFYDMVVEHDLSCIDFLEIVRNKVCTETNLGIVKMVMGYVARCLASLVPDDRLLEQAGACFDMAWQALYAAKDHELQICWAHALIDSAYDSRRVETLLKLMDHGTNIPGFEIDQAMRWSILGRYIPITTGASQTADKRQRLEAEKVRDPSDRGQREYETANAAFPDLQLKSELFDRFLTDTTCSLAVISSAMGGFNYRIQAELLRPFADRFFAEVERVFETRDRQFASEFWNSLFPRYRADDEIIRQTTELLNRLKPESFILKRKVIEGLDDLRMFKGCRDFAKRLVENSLNMSHATFV
eukprot:GILJ01005694.1.p1 GENE.GILJ01005694.1~~GILJ01005694.1.p1  ORF type:complete len:995 (-),score=154.05 GILJ01005694.1:73-2958(-)